MLQIGQQVQRQNDPTSIGVIVGFIANPVTGARSCRVDWGGRTNVVPESSLLLYSPSLTVWAQLRSGSRGGAREFRYALTHNKLRRPSSRVAGAFSGARTRFFPYQFKPLLKFLDNGEKRILIGDDVGLGKTIEAGYILTELQTSERLDRVLILVPSRLRSKWKKELKDRFGENFEIPSSRDVTSYLKNFRERESGDPFKWICSYESLRQEDIVDQFRESHLPIDLLVLDEAHRVRNSNTNQNKIASALCSLADGIVFLSATPVQTQLRDLWVLLNLLAPVEFGNESLFEKEMEENRAILRLAAEVGASSVASWNREKNDLKTRLEDFIRQNRFNLNQESRVVHSIQKRLRKGDASHQDLVQLQADLVSMSPIAHIFTRTRKREALENVPQRDASWCSVQLSNGEQQIYDHILRLCQDMGRIGASEVQTFACVMAYRAMASCIPAAVAYFSSRNVLSQFLAEDLAEESDDSPEMQLSLGDTGGRVLAGIIEMFKNMEIPDSKLEKLVAEFQSIWSADRDSEGKEKKRRKIVLFSFFTKTLDYLELNLLARGISCRKIHGKISIEDRETAIEEFLSRPDVDVLLTSDVGGEGIDLQRASVLFNYDLPWNPMVVEQRIGRIDRIGQEENRLIIRNFVVQNSIEERILQRLFERLEIFKNSIGDIEPILGGTESVEELTRRALMGLLDDNEMDARLEQISRMKENERIIAQNLQERVDSLGAADQVLLDEINAVTGEGQLPSEEEMLDYLNRALQASGAAMQLPPDVCSKIFPVHLTGVFSASEHLQDNDSYSYFVRKASTGEVRLTLSREVAYRYPSCELIHSNHPFIRWASHKAPDPARAFQILISSDSISKGRYAVLFASAMLQKEAKNHRILQSAIHLDSARILPEESTHDLVQAIRRAEHSRVIPVSTEEIDLAESTLSIHMSEQIERWIDEEKLSEQSRFERRYAAVEAGLLQKRDAARKLLRDLELRAAPEFPRRMARDKIKKAEERLSEHQKKQADTSTFHPEHEELMVVLIEVEP